MKDLVLVGGGHAHVEVLRRFGARPEPGVRVTLVSRDLATAYSGMLPGYVAGHYRREACHVDLPRLARATGARLVHGEVVGLDPSARRLALASGEAVAYDIASLDTGSTPRLDVPGAAAHALPVKPVPHFLEAWDAMAAAAERTGAAPRLAVVGGGAGGVELALAMHHRLSRAGAGRAELTLVTRDGLLPAFGAAARRRLAAELARRGIRVLTGAEIVRVDADALLTADGRTVPADRAIWATWAGAPAWLASTGLPLDPRGFLAVDAALRSIGDANVFAAGDVAAVLPHPRPKAGVFAVRQGPPLARNLRLALRGAAPEPFRPQRRALALIGTGDRRAVAAWGPFALFGAWVWRWKERVDRRWMRRYERA